MFFERWINHPEQRAQYHWKQWFDKRAVRAEVAQPLSEFRLRLATLADARLYSSKAQPPFHAFLEPISLDDGVQLYLRRDSIWQVSELPVILHFQGGIPEYFARFRRPALIVRLDSPGLARTQLKQFGEAGYVSHILEQVLQTCSQNWNWQPRLHGVVLSAFGAGYAPLLSSLSALDLSTIKAIFLLDGFHSMDARAMYAGSRDALVSFVRQAAWGDKLLVLTHTALSFSDTSAASVAQDLAAEIGAKNRPSGFALADDWCPETRVDLGGFHIEGYPGRTVTSHVAQIQQVGILWQRYLSKSLQ